MRRLAYCLIPTVLAGCLFGGGEKSFGPDSESERDTGVAADLGEHVDGARQNRTDTDTPETGTPDTGTPDTGPDAQTDQCALVTCPDGLVCDPSTGICESTCDPTQQVCDGTCVDTEDDPFNCGECDVSCDDLAPTNSHVRSCTAGTCVFECDQGRLDLNMDLSFPDSDGCEAECVPSMEICDGVDNDCNGSTDDGLPQFVYYPDSDRDSYGDPNRELTSCQTTPPDGYVSNDRDCDDDAVEISPSAPEICDGFDNDCDGTINEELPSYTWWKDEDGDGVGGSAVSTSSGCDDQSPGPEWVSLNNDCDDQNSSRYPGNPEICDGIDNDCDNAVDDGLPLNSYYRDADSDSWGRNDDVLQTCSTAVPPGRVVRNGDCNDGNSSIYPGAPEACDGIDADCGGGVENPTSYYVDDDRDGYGGAAVVTLCSGPQPGHSTVSGDCDDNDARRAPGNQEVCDGVDNDCNDATNDSAMCPQTIFVTSATFQGNVNSSQTADSKCQTAGALVNPSWGNWKAVLSTPQDSAQQRIRQIGTVHNVGGDQLFAVNEMFNSAPRAAVKYVETGATVDSRAPIWTGTKPDGTTSTDNCQGFSTNASAPHGTTGAPGFADSRWVDYTASNCNTLAALMCIDGQE